VRGVGEGILCCVSTDTTQVCGVLEALLLGVVCTMVVLSISPSADAVGDHDGLASYGCGREVEQRLPQLRKVVVGRRRRRQRWEQRCSTLVGDEAEEARVVGQCKRQSGVRGVDREEHRPVAARAPLEGEADEMPARLAMLGIHLLNELWHRVLQGLDAVHVRVRDGEKTLRDRGEGSKVLAGKGVARDGEGAGEVEGVALVLLRVVEVEQQLGAKEARPVREVKVARLAVEGCEHAGIDLLCRHQVLACVEQRLDPLQQHSRPRRRPDNTEALLLHEAVGHGLVAEGRPGLEGIEAGHEDASCGWCETKVARVGGPCDREGHVITALSVEDLERKGLHHKSAHAPRLWVVHAAPEVLPVEVREP
jgi:hypothetical protein